MNEAWEHVPCKIHLDVNEDGQLELTLESDKANGKWTWSRAESMRLADAIVGAQEPD